MYRLEYEDYIKIVLSSQWLSHLSIFFVDIHTYTHIHTGNQIWKSCLRKGIGEGGKEREMKETTPWHGQLKANYLYPTHFTFLINGWLYVSVFALMIAITWLQIFSLTSFFRDELQVCHMGLCINPLNQIK